MNQMPLKILDVACVQGSNARLDLCDFLEETLRDSPNFSLSCPVVV